MKNFHAQSQAYVEVFFDEDFFNEIFLKYHGGVRGGVWKANNIIAWSHFWE